MPIPFQLPRVYPILDTRILLSRQCTAVTAGEALIEAGVRILQYRHKSEWKQSNFDEARTLARMCQDAGVLFVLNDRADFANLLGAALHVGQQDIPPVAARRIVNDEVMGFSTHNKLQLVRGDEEPVEYLSLGPIFATTSKKHPDPVVGLERLRQYRPLTQKPLVAIGGIDLLNAGSALEAGANSVAVISGILPEAGTKKVIKRHAEEWLRLMHSWKAPVVLE